jgi:hypothetical protein
VCNKRSNTPARLWRACPLTRINVYLKQPNLPLGIAIAVFNTFKSKRSNDEKQTIKNIDLI